MRVIKRNRLDEFCAEHSGAKKALLTWYGIVRKSHWRTFLEMRQTFAHADEIKVPSGRKAVVFNIKKNSYRLVTAVHYEKTVRDADGQPKVVEGKIFLFFFLTHAQYSKDTWKDQL